MEGIFFYATIHDKGTDMKTYDDILAEYKEYYDVDNLLTPNDRANFNNLIRNQLRIETLQAQVDDILKAEDDNEIDVIRLKKVQDILKDLTNQNLDIERGLAIDRKSRKKDDSETVAGYLTHLKAKAREYLDKQYITAWCQTCNVMVGRILPVHEHTAFTFTITCSQCKKDITIKRKEKNVFYDLKPSDRPWREQYPVEIELAQEDIEIEETEEEIIGE